jgi:hypothetical protein
MMPDCWGPYLNQSVKTRDRGKGVERRVEVEKSSRPSLSVKVFLD